MKLATISTLILALAFIPGCKQTETSSVAPIEEVSTEARELTPEELGALGARIEREPDRASEILAENGLTHESFEAQIRRVTEEPEASKRYAQAYEQTKS